MIDTFFEMQGLGSRLAIEMRRRAEIIETVEHDERLYLAFKFSEMNDQNSLEIQKKLRSEVGRNYLAIYTLRLTENDAIPIVQSEILQARKLKNRAYPKINHFVRNSCLNCLYVGQSKDIAKRLYEHIICANEKTYALHLSKWAQKIPGGLAIEIFKFGSSLNSSWVLQSLEDQLAQELNPLLGRTGAA